MKEYTTRSGRLQFKPSVSEAEQCEMEDVGFCLACGAMDTPAEPDAARYACESCGARKVYGIAELACMGLVHCDEEPKDVPF